ncbi:CBS domain-containing protein [Lyngbya aestuarii]|uniref:CBS domain-containing protein n=1 Tax=Lyngbya aestuarii TaxID=118322 RepID=UPI00403DF30F
MSGTSSSCVLVMEKQQLLGIFTERDLVRLTSEGRNFEDVKVGEVMSRQVITLPLAKFQDIFAAVFLFRRYRIRHLPIVDEQGQLVGIVSPESIRQMLQPANLLKLRRVAEVMTPDVVSLPLTTSVLDVARLMTQQQISGT